MAIYVDGEAPPPTPPDAEHVARDYMQQHSTAYFGKDHPQHDQVVQGYRDRLAGRVTPPPLPARVEPHPDAFAFLARDAEAEPFVLTPELEKIAALPTSPPPSAGPDDPLARVPATPRDYALAVPHLEDGPGLDAHAVDAFKAEAHAQRLSTHQAQALLNSFAVRGIALRHEAGDDPLSPAQIGEVVAWCKGHGFTKDQTTWAVDSLDRADIPRRGKPAQATEAENLMRDPDSGYFTPTHPKHHQTRERVAKLFAESSAAPGYYRR
jgi:hypothetical protein